MKCVNPIIPGFYPDPSICRVGGDYYLATSSFEYFPGVPIFHSRDLVNWTQIGHCLTRESQLSLHRTASSLGIWAPTLRYHEGWFYMVTTDVFGGKGHLIVKTQDPAGPWSEPVIVPTDGDNGFDPDLFFDADGSVWFSWKGVKEPGIFTKKISLADGSDLGPRKLIWAGFEDIQCEAPHIYRIGAWYYLIAAEGGTFGGHMVVAARSKTPDGPYEGCPHNPLLTHRADVFAPLQCTGHGDLVETPDGSWWMVFLAVRKRVTPECFAPYHLLGRETCLAPVTWDAEGWPVVNAGKSLSLEIHLPGVDMNTSAFSRRDEFNTPELSLEWNFRRNPPEGAVSLTENPGSLTLHGAPSNLDALAPVAFLCRRQQHYKFRAATEVTFDPDNETDEAGLAIQMNERHFYQIVIRRLNGQRKIFVRHRIGHLCVEREERALSPGPVILTITADHARYEFGFISAGETIPLDRVDARYLATEIAGGFTGVYLGPYASGNGQPSPTPAQFAWFEYTGLPES
nr:glycoside hydrolase family 43 protein [Oscillatoria laete-virens]